MLYDFNTEYSEPTPGPQVIAERLGPMLTGGEATVLLGGAGPTASRCCVSSPPV